MRRILALFVLTAFAVNSASAGISVVRSSGITLTGVDGIQYFGTSGITLTGVDGFLNANSNGITLTGVDGITLTGVDSVHTAGVNAATYSGPNSVYAANADGITLTGVDGITITGVDGITLTGVDGTTYTADTLILRQADGITLTGVDGITLTGVDTSAVTGPTGVTRVGSTGFSALGADGITLTGVDGITLTGVDHTTVDSVGSVTGIGPSGVLFELVNLDGITLTGVDGITLTGVDQASVVHPQGITLTGVDGITLTGVDQQTGFQSLDPELAQALNTAADDSSINAVIVYHGPVTDADLDQLRAIGIFGGTRMRVLPMVYVSATRPQLVQVSHLQTVRSLYGNRTLNFNSDPYFEKTGIQRVAPDQDLRNENDSLPVTGRGVTVAVLDTGINSQHPDLAGRVAQNVRLTDLQSAAPGFLYPTPIENVANTDLGDGHGTFVSGVIAAGGQASNGRLAGVAPGSRLVGLSAGDANLVYVLSGFDYLLEKGPQYGVRVVNCSFSANTVFDFDDPVNVATKLLTDRGVSVVFSAGNSGPGNGTLNPYASAPWVIGVGATDARGRLAPFSSRGNFGDEFQNPSLAAPGVDVASLRSLPTVTGISGLGGTDAQRLSAAEMPYYTTASGTSFSAPQVAGAIALMLEANPNLTPAKIKEILTKTATPLPNYFYHEAGAGMLNTHAAVLEAAFPDRDLGVFRSIGSKNSLRFVTSTASTFQPNVYAGQASVTDFQIPANTVQASTSVQWATGPNDFGIKVFNSSNSLVGESNYVNLPGLTGRREKVVLRNPAAGSFRAAVSHSAGVGTTQQVFGGVEVTTVQYPSLNDLAGLDPQRLADAQESLLTSVLLPEGHWFRPDGSVTRVEFAAAILRAGLVPQYASGSPMYQDVRDGNSRNAVESVQANPSGRMIYDAAAGSRFYPYNQTSKLVAAVAYVRAAGLESSAATATLPLSVADGLVIPQQLRGFAAVALQRGFLSLDAGGRFNPARPITRIELSRALNSIVDLQ